MNCHSTCFLLSFKSLSYNDQEKSYGAINKDEQYNYCNTCLLKPLRGIFQFQVSCHIWANTIEYTVDYTKQNGTDFRFIG